MKKRLVILFSILSILIIGSVILSYAQDVSPYLKTDFEIEGGVLKGFTNEGLAKHNALPYEQRKLIIPEDWGITEIGDYAFANVASQQRILYLYPGKYSNPDLNLDFNDKILTQKALTITQRGNGVFKKFSKIKLANTVETIGVGAFARKDTTFHEGNYFNSEGSTYHYNNIHRYSELSDALGKKFAKVELGTGIRTIKAGAFYSFVDVSGSSSKPFNDYYSNAYGYEIDLSNSLNLSVIGNYAFHGVSKTNLDFSKHNITKLGKYAFTLNFIRIKNMSHYSLDVLSEGVFAYCAPQDVFDLDFTNIRRIEPFAFYQLSQKDTAFIVSNIPKGSFSNVEYVGDYAFTSNFNSSPVLRGRNFYFKDLDLSNCDYVGIEAFENSKIFDKILFKENMNIEERAFSYTDILNINELFFEKGMSLKSGVFQYFEGNLKKVEFEEGWTRIPDKLFSIATASNHFVVEYSYHYPSSIETIIIPDSVISIGKKAFFIKNMKKVEIQDSSNLLVIDTLAFAGATASNGLVLGGEAMIFPTDIVLPKKIQKIGERAFFNRKLIRHPISEEYTNLLDLDTGAFQMTTFLEQQPLKLPYSLANLGGYTFSYSKIHSVVFYEEGQNLWTITRIPTEMFYKSLFTHPVIHLPDSFNHIESRAFALSNLKEINLDNIDYLDEGAFSGTKLSNITLSENIKIISRGCFSDTMNLHTVNFNHANLDNISLEVFYNSNISELLNLDSVKNIGANAFYNTSNLTSFDFKKYRPTSIETQAFSGSGLTSAVLLSQTTYGDFVFKGTRNLKSLEIEEGVSDIKQGMFKDSGVNSNFISFAGKNTLKRIHREAFMNAKNITDHSIFEGVVLYGDEAFRESGLTSVKINEEVESIGQHAFAYNQNLKKVEINKDLGNQSNFKRSIFYACEGLTQIVLGDNVENLSQNIFARVGVSNLDWLNNVKFLSNGSISSPNLRNIVVGQPSNKLESLECGAIRTGYIESITINPPFNTVHNYDNYPIVYYDEASKDVFIRVNTQINLSRKTVVSSILEKTSNGTTSLDFHVFYDDMIEEINLIPIGVDTNNGYLSHQLSELKLPRNLKKISVKSFYNTKISTDNLKIVLPESLEEISPFAFYKTKNIVIPKNNNLKHIGNEAFYGAKHIHNEDGESILNLSQIETIGNHAFNRSSNDIIPLQKVKLGNKVKTVGSNAFHNHTILDFNIIEDKDVMNSLIDNMKINQPLSSQNMSFSPKGKIFSLKFTDYKGDEINIAPQYFVKLQDGTWKFTDSFLSSSSNTVSTTIPALIGSYKLNISKEKLFHPVSANPVLIKGNNHKIDTWIQNYQGDGELSLLSEPDYNSLGVQEVTMKIAFNDGSYTLFPMRVTIVDAQTNTWVPNVEALSVKRGQSVIISDAVKNPPSNAVLVKSDTINTTTLGTKYGNLVYRFNDLSEKTVRVTVIVTENVADTWIPQIKSGTAKKTNGTEQFDLESLVEAPTEPHEIHILEGVALNQAKGTYRGKIRYTFTQDSSYKDIEVIVYITDDTVGGKIRKQDLSTTRGVPIDVLEGVIEKPSNLNLRIKENVDFDRAGVQFAKIIGEYPDHSEVEILIKVSIKDLNTEAGQFIPQLRKLNTTRGKVVPLENGLLNQPSNAVLTVTKTVDFNNLGIKFGELHLVFSDSSELDLQVEVEVFEADFFEVGDESEIPSTHAKVTFTNGEGTDFEEDYTDRIFAVKKGEAIKAKYFPKVIVKPNFDEDTIQWNPNKDLIIQDNTDFVSSASQDNRTQAQKFEPITKVLLTYLKQKIDIRTGLLNPPGDLQEFEIRVEPNVNQLGMQTGVLHLKFADDSELDIDIKVNVVDKIDSKASNFVPQTRILEVDLGDQVNIKQGLLNSADEYHSLTIIKDVSTTQRGQTIGLLLVKFDDDSQLEVPVVVIVKSNIPLNSKADNFSPLLQTLEVKVGESVDLKTGLLNDNLDGITITIIKNVDTGSVGQKIGTLGLAFDDNSSLEVFVSVLVKPNPDLDNQSGNNGNNNNQPPINLDFSELKELLKDLGKNAPNHNLNLDLTELKKLNESYMEQIKDLMVIIKEKDSKTLGKPIIKNKILVKSFIPFPKTKTFKPDAKLTRGDLLPMIIDAMNLKISNKRPLIQFKDVQPNLRNNLNIVVSNGIISGYSDKTFRPTNPITRGEFSKIIAEFLTDDITGEADFKDIKGNWAEKYITKVYLNGIVNGYPDSSFRPNGYISRAEAIVMLNKLSNRQILHDNLIDNADLKRYIDVPVNHWAYKDILSALNGFELQEFIWSKDKEKKLHYRLENIK